MFCLLKSFKAENKYSGGGVVRLGKGRFRSDEERIPSVPTETAFHVLRSQICVKNSTVDVLPLVPVTETKKLGRNGQNFAQAFEKFSLTLSEVRIVTFFGKFILFFSVKIATAPFSIAWFIKLCPSDTSPEMAAKRQPFCACRESLVK